MNVLIGQVLENEGNFQIAVEYFNKGLKVYESLNDKENIGRTRIQLGRTCADALLFEAAMSHLNAAMSIYQSLEDTLNIAYATLTIGYVHERASRPNQALEFYEKADSINQFTKDERLDGLTTEGIASIYEDLEMYDRALEVYEEIVSNHAENIIERIDALNNIGDCHRKSGNALESLPYYREAYRLANQRNILFRIQQNARDLANAYEMLGNKDSSLHYFKEYSEIYRINYDQKNIAYINQMQILYEFEQKDKEIQMQKSQAEIQHWQNRMMVIGISILIFAVLFLIYLVRSKARMNRKLSMKSERIEQSRKELSESNKELQTLLDKLKETQRKLIHSEKMAAVGTLSAGIAHEINNPLNYIQGSVDVIQSKLEKQIQDDPELNELISAINIGVERTATIVKSLNGFSRSSDDQEQDCNIHEIIENCLTMLQYTIKNRIEIKKAFTNQKFTCKGNEGNLHQVFLNLLVNSAHAIKKRGEILISTTVINGQLTIKISDTGTGIDPEILDKIKDPFFSTKETGKGTGLGLSITNKIIEDHNGQLIYESEKGVGTTATVTLPIQS